ncbi:MAG: SapC family protein [Caulobacteraceae bacterium]|nr:SapC family protein [Caulobacter sp.]
MSSTVTSNPQAPDGGLTGNVPMYVQPEPLSLQLHGDLGVTSSETPFGFAATATAVPLQVTEFGPAALSFPIIFAGEAKMPLAVMGVRDNENAFINEEGRFEPTAYIPAFVRRYPFVLADDPQQQRLVVCIDRKAAFLTPEAPTKLFANGEATEYTKNAIQFCQDFEAERQRTDQFVNRLRELDLFESKQETFQPRNDDGSLGEAVQLADYFAVSEEKLNKLAPEVLVELRDTGALRQIYAHMTSLFGWERLVTRVILRAPVAGSA